ncbi:MAG: hypothetical protein Q4G59_12080, partial [Planctomycetia bacterium]|nr:hypothetical protein [Planctomycetia bacterium]
VKLVLENHQTMIETARQVGCTPASIQLWIKKSQKKSAPQEHGFIPLQIVENSSVDLVLPNGFMFKINNASPEFIAAVFRTLASC